LGTIQAALDGGGWLGVNAVPSNPGVNLAMINETPYGGLTGVYQQLKSCIILPSTNTGQRCDTLVPPLPACVGSFCLDNPDWVFVGITASNGVSTSTPNFAYGASSNAGICRTDMGCSEVYYGGTLMFDAPATARGIYTFGFDPAVASTFMNNCAGVRITGVGLTAGSAQFTVIDCCEQLGGGLTSCTPGVPANDCDGPGQTPFPAGSCVNPAFECPSCQTNDDCAEDDSSGPGGDNMCTSNICNPDKTCSNPPNYNTLTECCNPTNGGKLLIDDGDACTVDTCDPDTGIVTNDPVAASGMACDDGFGCTYDDKCDGISSQADGGCIGLDVNGVDCSVDPCPVGTCDPVTLTCVCSEDTPLCVFFEGDNCYEVGATVNASIEIGGGSEVVTGGQFLLSYDPTCIDFESIGPCAGSLFTNVIASNVNEAAGTIFYTATVDPFDPVGTQGPAKIACMVFTKLGECGECDICFESVNPFNTILTNDDGNAVPLDSCVCSEEIGLAGVIEITTPPGDAVNSECDLPTAIVEWNTPVATDECDGPLQMFCDSEHDGGVPIGHLIMNGGEFPQGKSFFLCEATNSCGDTLTKVWTVDVSDKQALDVYVQLSPTMNPGLFSRCIKFELFDSCSSATVHEELLWFDGPYNFDGKARMQFKVPKGQYDCITAQDQLHTLRSAAPIECIDGVYYAEFRGDPILGGNWLIGGNLDGWKKDDPDASQNVIDILDFGQFMNEIASGAAYGDGNTDCTTTGPHADINADGDVDNFDYAFILDNYLVASKDACAGCPGHRTEYVPVESITVKQLRAQGMGELAVADLNRDGVLDSADMDAYMQGVQPVRVQQLRKETKVDGLRGR
jgi:hypothetical protein